MLKTSRLATKLLWREAHAGEWMILFLALVFSVTVVTTLDFYTSRIKTSITQQSNRILGGDLAVVSAQPIPAEWENEAERLDLKHAQVWTYPSVIKGKDEFQLATIQAVSDSYPILSTQTHRPAIGAVWVEPRLLPLLKINVNDEVMIGDKHFVASQQLTPDIDQLTTGLSIAPRVLMRLQDVPATKTVLPGSRVEFRLLLAGDQRRLDAYKGWLGPKLIAGQRLVTVRDQQAFINRILTRTDNYLQLVMLICIVMSSIAIMLSVYQYLRRHYNTVALWRCLGVERQQLIGIFVTQLGIIALLAGAVGIALGYLLQTYLNHLLANILPLSLNQAGVAPVLKGFVTSLLMLSAFAYPLITELPKTSPLYMWRGETTTPSFNTTHYLITILATLSVLLYWIMDVSTLTLFFIDIILFAIAVMYGLNIALLALTKRLLPYTKGAVKRGLSHLVQHPTIANLQFSGVTLILTCLFMLGFVRASLVENWQQSLPANTPNYFVFNIAPDDVDGLTDYFKQQQIPITAMYPMARGRLVELNGQPILSAVPANARGHNALHRELNLSWMQTYPADNKIVAGNAWHTSDQGKALASVEKTMADQLHLKLGDTLTFQFADTQIKTVISNIRTLDWTSFHPNFYVIFPPGLIESLSATYITSFHLNPEQAPLLNELISRFPNITVIDVASMVKQIQSLIGKVSSAIQYLFLLALGSALLILVVTIQTSMDERRQTWKVLRIIGASRRYLVLSTLAEFGYLAILILVTALALSQAFAFFLERNLFG